MVQLNFPDYSASSEDAPMTMLVGLVGKDGWVIGADRRQRDASAGITPVIATSSATDKIALDPNSGMVYASAGDNLARMTGDEIVQLFSQGELPMDDRRGEALRLYLKEVGDRMWEQQSSDSPGSYSADNFSRGLLLGFQAFPKGMLCLSIGRHSDAEWMRFGARTFGDTGNGAKYFLCRYFESFCSEQDKLIVLTAHVIAQASKLNPIGVGDGLDIVVCHSRNDGWEIEPISEVEITDALARSRILDELIEVTFLDQLTGFRNITRTEK